LSPHTYQSGKFEFGIWNFFEFLNLESSGTSWIISETCGFGTLELWNFGTWDLELGTWNLEFGTWNLELGIWNLELGTWNLESTTGRLATRLF
jgi:hypothetical protein